MSCFSIAFTFDADLVNDVPQAAGCRSNLQQLLIGVKIMKRFGWSIGNSPDSSRRLQACSTRSSWSRDALEVFPTASLPHIQRIEELVHAILQDTYNRLQRTPPLHLLLRDNLDLPASEKVPSRLVQGGTLMLMAGTESPARSLMIVHFHFLSKPVQPRRPPRRSRPPPSAIHPRRPRQPLTQHRHPRSEPPLIRPRLALPPRRAGQNTALRRL